MAAGDVLMVEIDEPVAIVTLNRPASFNAFNTELRAQLLDAVREIDADPRVRIVVLKGAGPGFCAGADLREGMPGSVTEQIEREYKPFLMAIAESPKLWIAAIHGSAAGIGAALAMTCDLAVMDAKSNIYLAFAAIGLIPDGGATWHLVRAMGSRRALETILEGKRIDAETCLSLGLVNKVTAPGESHETAVAWARQFATGAPLAQRAAKRAVRAASGSGLSEAISLEAQLQYPLTHSQDFKDGVAAFFQKRKPVFSGR
jgi:2-(1,2-epoxy-1,2-dihydrophenyl)acetyl-CoA isomerase